MVSDKKLKKLTRSLTATNTGNKWPSGMNGTNSLPELVGEKSPGRRRLAVESACLGVELQKRSCRRILSNYVHGGC